jgi:hypothetical protein
LLIAGPLFSTVLTALGLRSDTPDGPCTASPLADREAAVAEAVDEPRTRGFLPFPGQKSANPPASRGGETAVPESFEAAAVRELAEETDLIVAVEDGHPVRDARGRQLRRAE